MIESFFRHLEEHEVDWLLISGQATILYGAATFSEDIDLWVDPEPPNLERFQAALRASRAVHYKLTPPLTAEFAARHHAFHFVVPHQPADLPVYLDVMACPPRAGTFVAARKNARTFSTQWGALPTVGIRELVELKKTQRLRDYPVISRLALAWLEERQPRDEAAVTWALENIFTLTELRSFLLRPEVSSSKALGRHELVRRAAEQLSASSQLEESLEDALEDWFDGRIALLRRADRRFWRPVIDELRKLRAAGRLMVEGSPV